MTGARSLDFFVRSLDFFVRGLDFFVRGLDFRVNMTVDDGMLMVFSCLTIYK